MALYSQIEVLSPKEIERVHDASIKILEETGIIFHSEEALNIFKDNGFKTDGDIVFFSGSKVQEALDKCPQTFEFHARNPDNTVIVGEKKHLIQPAFGCVFVQEPGKPRRKGVLQDYINYQRLIQQSSLIQLAGGVPIVASELATETRHLYQMYNAIKYTDKPIIGWAASENQTDEMLDMLGIAFGSQDFLESHQVICSGINPLSPLSYSTETLECVIANAKRNQVLMITPAAMAGITGPIDLLGTAIMQNAEMLSCITLIQLIQPGVPVIYSPASVVGDMRRASFCTGSPEGMLINMVNFQLGRALYKLPTRTLCGHTDAKVTDYQAGYETMQANIMASLGGAEILTQALGTLESYMTISYEKFILDEEIYSRNLRIAAGVDTSNIDDSIQLIQEVAHKGSYLTHPSTFKKFRQNWQPMVADLNDYSTWEKQGSKDAVERAREIYLQKINSEEEILIDPDLDKELLKYIQTVEGKL